MNDTKIQANPESSRAEVRNSGSTTRSRSTAMLMTPVDQPQMKMPRSTQWSEKRWREMMKKYSATSTKPRMHRTRMMAQYCITTLMLMVATPKATR